MPTKLKNEDRQPEAGAQSISPTTVYSQPWWYGVGNSVISSVGEPTNGVVKAGAQLQANRDDVTKDTHPPTSPQSGLNGNNSQEPQHLKHVASSMPHLETNSQMELVGHSIVLTSYQHQDPQYAGIMTYGAQVYPHLLGIPQTRMPLPLEMEEEPVYVNAKQYHGILRRRQSRAKAELEKKAIKDRKPYLHESRHLHALRRARGCGGRFLNTKKLDSNGTNPTSEKEPKSGTTISTQSFNSSGSEHLSTDYEGNSGQQKDRGPMFQDVHKSDSSSNGNSNGHRVSSMYNFHLTGREKGVHYLNQERGSARASEAPNGGPH